MTAPRDECFAVLVAGVGGQGVLTMTRILAKAAMLEGQNVVAGQQHGMSQRGGTVENTLVFGNRETPFIGPGEADVVVAMDPIEADRNLERMSGRTVVLVNEAMIVPFNLTLRGSLAPVLEEILDRVRRAAGRCLSLDAQALAREAGDLRTVNMVLLGVGAGLGLWPARFETLRELVASMSSKRSRAVNAAAFELGMRFAGTMQAPSQAPATPRVEMS